MLLTQHAAQHTLHHAAQIAAQQVAQQAAAGNCLPRLSALSSRQLLIKTCKSASRQCCYPQIQRAPWTTSASCKSCSHALSLRLAFSGVDKSQMCYVPSALCHPLLTGLLQSPVATHSPPFPTNVSVIRLVVHLTLTSAVTACRQPSLTCRVAEYWVPQ